MSYDSSTYNANPNNTQTPARHDDLPAPTGADHATTRGGEAGYPYVAGGDRPEPATIEPRFGMPAAGHVNLRGGDPGFLQDATADSTNAFRDTSRFNEEGLGSTTPAHRLHSQNETLPAPRDSIDDKDTEHELEPPPAHRIHSQNEPLPGPRIDNDRVSSASHDSSAQVERGQNERAAPSGANAFHDSNRPLKVQPVQEGGVAVAGKGDLPEGRANTVDKVVGKTEKVLGKATGNWEMHERGELRESGGKAAAKGQARAPHD